jgi:peptide/nickel transport system ATP-binding protein
MSTRIAVMYLGEVVESAATDPLYARPAHPYTEALLLAAPDVEEEDAVPREGALLTGDVPNPVDKPSGCPFRTRCPHAQQVCAEEHPALQEVAPGRHVACHFPLVTPSGDAAPHALPVTAVDR